jgi:HK97 family phage major capsid protein
MKLKLSVLLGIAQKNGYTGSANDADAVRKHLIALKVPMALDGEAVNLETVEIVDGQKAETISLGSDAKAVETKSIQTVEIKSDNTGDIDTKIAAGVESALKKMGVQPNGRPQTEVRAVKSVQEAMYETKIRRKQAAFSSFENAVIWKDWMLAKVLSRDVKASVDYADAIRLASKNLNDTIGTKAYATTPTAAGGALVPEILHADLQANLLQYGVTRRLAKVVQMQSDRDTLPAKSGIHTLSYPQEGSAPSSATTGVTYSNISLQARMGVAYTKVSRQLNMDSVINAMDDQATELIRCVAYTEDNAFINGTGQTNTGGMVGCISKWGTLGTTTSNYVTGGTSWSAYTMTMLTALLGKIPDYARGNAVWLCSPEFAGSTLSRLSAAQGGVTWKETVDYGYVQMFLGRPVVTINVMNTNDNVSSATVDLIYGDFSRACIFGDRMAPEIDVSDQPFWTENNLGIKVTVRHDINWWDPTSAVAFAYST